MDKTEWIKQVKKIASTAGKMLYDREKITIKTKGDVANLVTSMDTMVQEYIIKELMILIPEAKIIAEENDFFSYDDGYVWIIDPIDGTTNFAYDLKCSAISIALVYQNEGMLGVVYNPYLQEFFIGVKGIGSYLNDVPIQVNQNDFKHSLIAVGTAPYRKDLATRTFDLVKDVFSEARDIRRSGSAVLDMCYVACGRYDAFFELSLSPWDYAASYIILKEAKAEVASLDFDEWCFDQTMGIVAGNKNNFKKLKNIINS